MNPLDPHKREVQSMLAVGELLSQYNGLTLAGKEIQRGGNLDSLVKRISAQVREDPLHLSANKLLGLPEKEVSRYSLGKVIHAQTERNWTGAGLEKSISDTITGEMGVVPNGCWVPLGALLSRDFNAGSATEAGPFIGREQGPVGDPLRAASVLAGLGANIVVGQKSTLHIPRFANAAAPPGWLGEVAAAQQLEPITATVELTPKRAAAQVVVSMQFLAQNPRGEEVLTRYLVTALLAQLEQAAFNGTGSANDPVGIRSAAGVGNVVGGNNGATLAWSHLVDLEKTCAVANAPDGAAGFALNPQTRAWLRQKPRGTGLNYCWDDGERNLLGHRVGVTANLPSDLDKGTSVGVCSSLIFSCDWKQLWLCWYGPLAVDVLTDRYSRAPEGKLVITAAMLVGAGVAQPAAFAKMDDCLLS